jgi:outer membrane protein assembly factor BamB
VIGQSLAAITGIVLGIFATTSCQLSLPSPPLWEDAVTTHQVVDKYGKWEKLWSRSNVFTGNTNVGVLLAAKQKKVFILGSLKQTEREAVVALDAAEDELLWRVLSGTASTLDATSFSVYVGTLGSGHVEAYELDTGQILWSTHLLDARSIRYLYILDATVQVNSYPDVFHLINADTGKIIWKLEYEFGQNVFLRTDEVSFIQLAATSLQAVENVSGSLVWEIDVGEIYLQGPVFTQDRIFIRTGRGLGSVYAIDRREGKILWRSERNVISNVAATNFAVYFLTLDGKLWEFDAKSGKVITSVEFKPAPFVLNGPKAKIGGYYVAVDEQAGLVYALLGDSAQLFAFKIQEH